VQKLIAQQLSTKDKAQRTKLIGEIQDKVAADLSTLPFLQGAQVAVVGTSVTGTEKTLDPSFKFRYAVLAKG
jgi:peptide/nickel transport system substrate-binding protein